MTDLTVISERLAPPAPGQSQTYAVQTRSEIRVPGHQLVQASAALVRLSTLDTGPAGCWLELTTLELRPEAPTPQVALLTDIARHHSPLQLRTTVHGALLRVTNKATLAAQWQQVQPWLHAKYRTQPGALALLSHVAGQYGDEHDHLEQALAHKGPYGVLLPGFFGLHSWQGDTRTDTKTVHQALGQTALPLRVTWTADPAADAFAPTVEVHGLGRLDRTHFDEAAAQAFLATLRGDRWTGPPAPLQVYWREQYTVGRLGQGLLAGRQSLRLAVDQLYFADLTHTVRPAASLPPA